MQQIQANAEEASSCSLHFPSHEITCLHCQNQQNQRNFADHNFTGSLAIVSTNNHNNNFNTTGFSSLIRPLDQSSLQKLQNPLDFYISNTIPFVNLNIQFSFTQQQYATTNFNYQPLHSQGFNTPSPLQPINQYSPTNFSSPSPQPSQTSNNNVISSSLSKGNSQNNLSFGLSSPTLTSSPRTNKLISKRSTKEKNVQFNKLYCNSCKIVQLGKFSVKTPVNETTCEIYCKDCSTKPPSYCKELMCSICKNSVGIGYIQKGAIFELICFSCDKKYMFCTECGGGGKFRIGKYRPIELFTPGLKKTCTLSHLRIGSIKISWQLCKLGKNSDEYKLYAHDIVNILNDGIYSLLAGAKSLEHPRSKYKSFSDLEVWINQIRAFIDNYVKLEMEECNIKRFISLARNGTHERAENIGFGIFEINTNFGTLCLRPFTFNMMAYTVSGVLRDMICDAVRWSQDYANQHSFDPIQYVWFALDDNEIIKKLFTKIKFKPIDEFLLSNPEVDRDIFTFVDNPYLCRGKKTDFTTYVCKASEFTSATFI
ncbi:hypothetical protein HK099_007670 [Clydaea vesicula]|uniref:Uncharacterized protein n=1 Tax=Clydaea vesicula TaxID=447962 RepID=A0AAD5TW62_9FUNG|nr:hypothetical protein HK099_007670 [Clydaea vesicula]